MAPFHIFLPMRFAYLGAPVMEPELILILPCSLTLLLINDAQRLSTRSQGLQIGFPLRLRRMVDQAAYLGGSL
jgi:hypothetical protein